MLFHLKSLILVAFIIFICKYLANHLKKRLEYIFFTHIYLFYDRL